MNGILEFIILVGIGLGIVLLIKLFSPLELWFLERKYVSIISVIKQFGYMYTSSINSRGKGLIYRKRVDGLVIESLLTRYKFKSIELSIPYNIYDYVVLINFPEWEERYYNVVCAHGGLRLVHFYSLEVKLNNTTYQRPISNYLCNDMVGIEIEPFMRNSKEYIENILTSEPRDVLRRFISEEIDYWQNKINRI